MVPFHTGSKSIKAEYVIDYNHQNVALEIRHEYVIFPHRISITFCFYYYYYSLLKLKKLLFAQTNYLNHKKNLAICNPLHASMYRSISTNRSSQGLGALPLNEIRRHNETLDLIAFCKRYSGLHEFLTADD